jgi:hypothetical protein
LRTNTRTFPNMFIFHPNVVRAALAAKLTLGFFLTSLLVTVNDFREQLSCWAPLLYTILVGPLSEFSYTGAIQRTVSGLLYGSLLGTACAAVVFFLARYYVWLRVICIFVIFIPISILRLSDQHALFSIFTAVALGLVLNAALVSQALESDTSTASNIGRSLAETTSSVQSLMRQFCISASVAYVVGVFIGVVVLPVPASAALRDRLERVLQELGKQASALASELFGLVAQAEGAWREIQRHSKKTSGEAASTEELQDSDGMLSATTTTMATSAQSPLSGLRGNGKRVEQCFSVDFTFLDEEDYAALHEEGALFLQEQVWELQSLVGFAYREWTFPEVTCDLSITAWARMILAVREIVSRLAGVECILSERRRRSGYSMGLALDQLFRQSLVDVMRMWAIISASCYQLSGMLADSHWRWYRWTAQRHLGKRSRHRAFSVLKTLLETKSLMRIRQSALASGLVGYEKYWQQMMMLYQQQQQHDHCNDRDAYKLDRNGSRCTALFAEDVSAAWFSAIMMHRILDAVLEAYHAAEAFAPPPETSALPLSGRLRSGADRVRTLLFNLVSEFFALPIQIGTDVLQLGLRLRVLRWNDIREMLRTHHWQVVFFWKFFLLSATTLSVVTSIPNKTALRSDWNIIWLYYSVIITARPTTESAVSIGLMRVSGTIIGAALGFLVMFRPVIGTNAYAVTALSVFVLYILFYLAHLNRHKWLQYASRVGVLTYTLVVMCQYQGVNYVAQWQYALSRCVMTCAGVLLAVLVVAALSPRMAVRESRQTLGQVFRAAAEAARSFHAVYVTRDTSTQLPARLDPAFLLEHYSNFSSLMRSPSLVTLLREHDAADETRQRRAARATTANAAAEAEATSTQALNSFSDRAASLLLQRITTDLMVARAAVRPAFGGNTQFTMWRSGLFSAPQYILRGIDSSWLLLLRLEVIEGVLERPPIYTNRYTGAAIRLFIQPLESEWRALFDALHALSEAIHAYLSAFSLWHDLGLERACRCGSCWRHDAEEVHVASTARADALSDRSLPASQQTTELDAKDVQYGGERLRRAIVDARGHEEWLDAHVADALLLFRKRRARLWSSLTKRRNRVRRVALSRSLNKQERQVVDFVGALFLAQEEAERMNFPGMVPEQDSDPAISKPADVASAIARLDSATGRMRAVELPPGEPSPSSTTARLEAGSQLPGRQLLEMEDTGTASKIQSLAESTRRSEAHTSGGYAPQQRDERQRHDSAVSPMEEIAPRYNSSATAVAAAAVAVADDDDDALDQTTGIVERVPRHVPGGEHEALPLYPSTHSEMKLRISSLAGSRAAATADAGLGVAAEHPTDTSPNAIEQAAQPVREKGGRRRHRRVHHRIPPDEEESIVRELSQLATYTEAHPLFASSIQKPIHTSHAIGLPIDDFVHFSSYLFALRETLNVFDFAARMIARQPAMSSP